MARTGFTETDFIADLAAMPCSIMIYTWDLNEALLLSYRHDRLSMDSVHRQLMMARPKITIRKVPKFKHDLGDRLRYGRGLQNTLKRANDVKDWVGTPITSWNNSMTVCPFWCTF